MPSRLDQFNEKSPAFRNALLESERKRILGVVVFVLFFTLLALVRIFALNSEMSLWGLLSAAILIAFELGMFRAVNRSLRSGTNVSEFFWYCAITLESLFPASGVAFLSSPELHVDYRPLATPWVLAYVPIILLSVLRLSPRLCGLCGFASAIGYLLAASFTGWRFDPRDGFGVTETAVPYFALLLLSTGFVAAFVASQIRGYVTEALREAETRHQLEQVEHELKIARSIQQSLLPRVRPQIAGFAIAGWSLSADDAGGDFYDWKKLIDGRWAVFLADVTGHGIGPAMLASVCRAYSRVSFNGQDNLGATFRNINRSFSEDSTPERFATFVAAVFHEGSDVVELLSAGHGPVFIYRAGAKSFQYMNAHVLPFGILPEMDGAVPTEVAMEHGDMVLLITDGFFEWENPTQDQFGVERIAEVVREFSDREPETIIAELYQAVINFSQGTAQKDDLTAVLIKRVPEQFAKQ